MRGAGLSGNRESSAAFAGLAAAAVGVCCGLPALLSAGVLAGVAWIYGGAALGAALVVLATLRMAPARHRRACEGAEMPPSRAD